VSAAGFLGPFIDLQAAFPIEGTVSTTLIEAVQAAEAAESSVFQFGAFIVDGLEQGNLAFDLFRGLFLLSDPITGAIRAEAPTQQGLRDQIQRVGLIGPPGLTGAPGPPGVPGPGGPEVTGAEALRTLSAILDSLRRARETAIAVPASGGFPPIGPPAPLPPSGAVRPGGSVNQPVVLGSTGDPTGVRRPTFPNQEQLSRAQQIGQIIRNLLALRRARQNADKQRRAFEQFLATRLELLRRQQMPFGQSGFAAGPVGTAVATGLGAFGGTLLESLINRLTIDQTQLPGQQPAFPAAPGIPGLQGGAPFGGGGCPPLFRGAMSARMSPVPWFPVQAPSGKWFFFGHLGRPTFSKLKSPRRHHHHRRLR